MNDKSASRKRRDRSIRQRLTGTVLIPSVALLGLWTGGAVYLVTDAVYTRGVAAGVREVSIPGIQALDALQKERRMALTFMRSKNESEGELTQQQTATDEAIAGMREAAGRTLRQAPPEVTEDWEAVNTQLHKLHAMRSRITADQTTVPQVTAYFDKIFTAATNLFDTQARVVPDAEASRGGLTFTALFRASDMMSRHSALIANAMNEGQLSDENYGQFTRFLGAYRAELDNNARYLKPNVHESYRAMADSRAWKDLNIMESKVLQHGAWERSEPPPDIKQHEWQDVSAQISDQLNELVIAQASAVSHDAVKKGDDTLVLTIVGSVVALLAALGSIIVAIRVSRTLVDRTLVTRLERLRNDSLELARSRLPEIVQRLKNGEHVDIRAELPRLDHGRDEVGEVAEAFNLAQHTAVSAAVSEAKARDGAHNVFLGIAHRNQSLVHRQLKILDEMESREENSTQLGGLFELDHLATRARRTTENLIILGGKQPGRRWRHPVRLVDALRAAASETEEYARVRVEGIPEVSVTGPSVADTIHLIAELIDNGTSFSPPDSPVHVNSMRVARGVVVEVADQGLGMTDEVKDRANEMMGSPPDFDAMALNADSSLGLFVVARLSVRLGVQVNFDASRYGGTRATVLLPSEILAFGEPSDDRIEPVAPGRRTGVAESRQPGDSPTTASRPAESPEPAPRMVLSGSLDEPSAPDQSDVEASPPVPDTPGTPAVPAEPVTPPAEAATPATTAQKRPPLPQRRPQESLVAQLCDEPETDSEPVREGNRTLSAFQRGTRKGRQADESPDA